MVCFSLSKRSKLQHWGQKSQGKGLKLILSSEDHFPPPSGSEVTILAHTAAPECAMKPSLYKCVNCIQNTFNDSSLVLVMAYDSPSRFNGGEGSRHKIKNYSGTPLNGHPSKADTHDITDNSKSPNCPSIHFNT